MVFGVVQGLPAGSVDDIVNRVIAGPVETRVLPANRFRDGVVPPESDIEQLDRTEEVMVMAALAVGGFVLQRAARLGAVERRMGEWNRMLTTPRTYWAGTVLRVRLDSYESLANGVGEWLLTPIPPLLPADGAMDDWQTGV